MVNAKSDEQSKTIEIVVIDDDFDQAASFYSSRPSGGSKAQMLIMLKTKYKEDENLDPLVYILARHRAKYENTTPEDDEVCTCLTELAHDAYGPGGPMSGKPFPPPCKLHTKIKVNSCICDHNSPFTEDKHAILCPAHQYYDKAFAMIHPMGGFDTALLSLKKGLKVKRKGWKGRNKWIKLHPAVDQVMSYLELQYDDGTTTPWFPNRCDLMEEDWYVVIQLPSHQKDV